MNMIAGTRNWGREMPHNDIAKARAMLDLLVAIDRGGEQSQRRMAMQFGVALGLVNAYLKICVKKGYVKVKRLPARRYAYLLTPKGAAEKLRLSFLLLSNELGQFRHARAAYVEVFREVRSRGWSRVILVGASDLAEIAAICALEAGIEIAALVDAGATTDRFIGFPLVKNIADICGAFDGALITDVQEAPAAFTVAVAALGQYRVLAPAFFGFTQEQEFAA